MLQVVFMDNPPFVCPDWSPCQPSYPGHGWKALNTSEACLFGGLRTLNGVCIHGLKVELFKMLVSRLSGFGNDSMLTWDAISLWYTNSTITEVYEVMMNRQQYGSNTLFLTGLYS